jgi:DNA polymerase-3 subunit alpha
VEAIKAARESGGPFESLWDFCERVDCRTVNRKAIESLIKCGAFGSTGASRKGMLSVLEAAQGAGQKAQLDAQIGQGSIFDLGGFGGDDGSSGASPFAKPSHPAIPAEEFERSELLAVEKESIGIFITEHPLKEVREALRARVDTGCGEVMGRRDGEWVKIGGMITECKKIRTRSGAPMMFATLDDLDGAVEVVIFEKGLAGNEAALALDEIVLIKGRVDQKEAGKVCVIVQDVQPFKPTEAEISRARAKAAELAAAPPRCLNLRLDAARLAPTVLDDLRRLFEDYPGDCEVVLEMQTRTGPRRLRLGEGFRVAARNAALKAELSRLLGAAVAPSRWSRPSRESGGRGRGAVIAPPGPVELVSEPVAAVR